MLPAVLQQLCSSSTRMPDSTAAWVPVPQSQRLWALQHGKADIIAAHIHPGSCLMWIASGRLTWTGPSKFSSAAGAAELGIFVTKTVLHLWPHLDRAQ